MLSTTATLLTAAQGPPIETWSVTQTLHLTIETACVLYCGADFEQLQLRKVSDTLLLNCAGIPSRALVQLAVGSM